MKIACFTDVHNQQCMLNLPTVLRSSAVAAVDGVLGEWGVCDLAIDGGDNISDYPHWERSCALPYKNWLDIKKKLVDNFARCAKGGRVLYVGGNNDPILGDLPTRDNPPYNTCDFYHTGPMKDTLGELAEGEFFGGFCKSKVTEIYHLAFHYLIDGVDFFGLNLDPDDAFNNHDCTYNPASLVWLKSKLAGIDPDGNKLIFVVGHVNTACRETNLHIDYPRAPWVTSLHEAFRGHRNLFFLYGHVHGQDFMHDQSWQAVLHFDDSFGIINENGPLEEKDRERVSFSTVHMGGLRPFGHAFLDDGLTGTVPGSKEPVFCRGTGTPTMAQYLFIETDEEKVTFTVRNTGSAPGYSVEDRPEPYTVRLVK